MNLIHRLLWVLGLVKVRIVPQGASLAVGGTLSLTIQFRPRPAKSVTFNLETSDATIVFAESETSASAGADTVCFSGYAKGAGTAVLNVKVVPSLRLTGPFQIFFRRLSERIGLGCDSTAVRVDSSPIFIIVPHPDDEALIASGIIRNALDAAIPVKIIIVTNGDHLRGKKEYGILRQAESAAAMNKLGVNADDVIFLGYPGDTTGLLSILNNYLSSTSSYTSGVGSNVTYGACGLGNCDFHSWLTGSPALYNAANLLGDLSTLIKAFWPPHIYTVSRFDEHPDHRAVNYSITRVLQTIKREHREYKPVLHTAMVHEPSRDVYEDFWAADKPPEPVSIDFSGDDYWPAPLQFSDNDECGSISEFTPPPNLTRTTLSWRDIERVPVPSSMQTSDLNRNLKYNVLREYKSQPFRYLSPFCKREEIFWRDTLVDADRCEILAVAPLYVTLNQGEARVITVSLALPSAQRTAIPLETDDEHILAVPPAVVVERDAITVSFAVKALKRGRCTVRATLGTARELVRVLVRDISEGSADVRLLKSTTHAR